MSIVDHFEYSAKNQGRANFVVASNISQSLLKLFKEAAVMIESKLF